MSDQYKNPINPGQFDFLPEDARNLLDYEGSTYYDVPFGATHDEAVDMIVSNNLYRLGKELFDYGKVHRTVEDGETLTLSAYGTKLEPFSSFKVEGTEGTSFITAFPSRMLVSFKPVLEQTPQKVDPKNIPLNHWSSIGLTKEGIDEGKRLTEEKVASQKARKRGGSLVGLAGKRKKA